jgi:putative DNA primase/helicase
LTHNTEIPYHPDAPCPAWLRFLDGIFAGDTDLIQFVQRAIGYSLTGSTKEQVLLFAMAFVNFHKGEIA